jgi:hypothetical protein
MNDLLVIMPCTQEHGLMPEYLRQLREAEIDVHIERLESIPNGNAGGTHAYALDLYRRCAQRFDNYRKLVFSDAFDVLFYGTKEEVLGKIPFDHVLLAAERNCYPDQFLSSSIPGKTPWRFANGGLSCGTPESFLKWVEEIEKHPLYAPYGLNQRFYNLLLAMAPSPLVQLDETTELFYCMFLEAGELDFKNGFPVNQLCGTRPNFLHFNGKCFHPGVLARREASLHETNPHTDS